MIWMLLGFVQPCPLSGELFVGNLSRVFAVVDLVKLNERTSSLFRQQNSRFEFRIKFSQLCRLFAFLVKEVAPLSKSPTLKRVELPFNLSQFNVFSLICIIHVLPLDRIELCLINYV